MSGQAESSSSSTSSTPRASTSQAVASNSTARSSTESPTTPTTSSRSGTSIEDSVLEFLEELEADELELDEEEMFDDEEDDGRGLDGPSVDVHEPLMSRGRSRRRRRWAEDGRIGDRSLLELIPPLLLAHPLSLLPLLPLLTYSFLPAGVVLFVPVFAVLAGLSASAHIVIVYLAWYLKVHSFEEVAACILGKRVGVWAGRVAVVTAVLGLCVGWLKGVCIVNGQLMEAIHPILSPVIETYLPSWKLLQSRIFWIILAAMSLNGAYISVKLLDTAMKAHSTARGYQVFLALLVPTFALIIIGRTVEITKQQDALPGDVQSSALEAVKRGLGLSSVGSSSAAGLSRSVKVAELITATLTVLFTPHIHSLPIHSSLIRTSRPKFPIPCLISSSTILIFGLPLALVPYYLLRTIDPEMAPEALANSSGVLAALPSDDDWLNFARVLLVLVTLGVINHYLGRAREVLLKAVGAEREGRMKASRYIDMALWAFVTLFACVGGWTADKIELVGIIAVIAVGWFMPSIFFITTFHLRRPLAIVVPTNTTPARQSRTHSRTDSLQDPTIDLLLARKERQLQKRRLGRRLWQDLIVCIGILPVGIVCIVWALGAFFGAW